ncbi:MAG TPA: hypothetical protein PKJ97_02370 [Candidatus Bilamarchaeaceae archaeon]|nr:hypothetical protein [Candidatus Bilamarchaeaceae archaeon]
MGCGNGEGRPRMLAYPGSACLPAFRMREDSPHFRRLAKVAWRLMEANVEVGERSVRAFTAAAGGMVLRFPAGLGFDLTNTATILLRAVEGGRAARYCSSRGTEPGHVRLFVSLRKLLEYMRTDPPAGDFDAALKLEAEGILIRPRTVAVAAIPPRNGTYYEHSGTYSSDGFLPLGRMIILNSSPATVREIIRLEAVGAGDAEEKRRESASLMRLWRKELRMASYENYD